mgnify:CR=1 FL=1
MATTYASGDQTKQLILDISKSLFYEQGYAKTTYTDISQTAGINRALIPYHFKNKAALGAAVYNNIVDTIFHISDELLGAADLSEDLASAFHTVIFYRIFENSHFAKFTDDIFSEAAAEIFNVDAESAAICSLGKNFSKLKQEQLKLLVHSMIAVRQQSIHQLVENDGSYTPDVLADFYFKLVMSYAGYSGNDIQELEDAAIQLADLIRCDIEKDYEVSVSYR